MAPSAAPLAQLLLDSPDLAHRVLALLPLQALGTLACMSTGARALVAGLPEAQWQASTWPHLPCHRRT